MNINMSKASAYYIVNNEIKKQDIKELKKELDTLKGVSSVSINNESHSIAVDFDTTGVNMEQIERKIVAMGFGITDSKFENHIM